MSDCIFVVVVVVTTSDPALSALLCRCRPAVDLEASRQSRDQSCQVRRLASNDLQICGYQCGLRAGSAFMMSVLRNVFF